MTITAAGITELAAQECATAWLVLLTISHPSLTTPLRFTSDGVTTISNSQTYQPFPFEITLPDDVEGRAPQAQLRIAGGDRHPARPDDAADGDDADRPVC